MRLLTRTFLLCSIAAAAGIAAAGTVNVAFNAPHYADVGANAAEQQANFDALARHLQGLGQRLLPANQVLDIEVLDVDLAGSLRPSRRGASMIRVLRNGADWPRIKLHYTLQADGRPLRSGEEWVSDMGAALGSAGFSDSAPLYYEKRMLRAWFKERFGQAG